MSQIIMSLIVQLLQIQNIPICFVGKKPVEVRAATQKMWACVSDFPTETDVVIMDNCEKSSEGGSLEEVAVGHVRRYRHPPPGSPCFMAGFYYCSLAHLSV